MKTYSVAKGESFWHLL